MAEKSPLRIKFEEWWDEDGEDIPGWDKIHDSILQQIEDLCWDAFMTGANAGAAHTWESIRTGLKKTIQGM